MLMDNRLQKWRELKKKFMDKYNVVISSRARVYQHQGDNNRDGGRGGGRGGN
jgi:predicted methyltransferase